MAFRRVSESEFNNLQINPEEIPKDKPYCSWYYGVTGKLPKE